MAGSIKLVVEDNMPSRSDRPMADLNAGLSFPPQAEKTAERSWTQRQPDLTVISAGSPDDLSGSAGEVAEGITPLWGIAADMNADLNIT